MAPKRPKRRRRILILSMTLLVLTTCGVGGFMALGYMHQESRLANAKKAVAHREDLFVTLSASGEIDSVRRTLIECDLDNLSTGIGGQRFGTNGSSTIIDLVPEGTYVESGQVICRLDSSDYEELVRQQEIKVQQAQSDCLKAELDVKAAEIALREYEFGTLPQARQDYQGQIALNEADIKRQEDRLVWAKEMVDKGYISIGELVKERQTLLKSSINIAQARLNAKNLDKYTSPMGMTRLSAVLAKAREELSYQELRLRHREEQLDKFRKQLDYCTIRAPHEGLLIYANEPDDDPRVELGAVVRRHMDMFYLPDLSEMVLNTTIHESVVDRVKPGMPAQILVTALPKLVVEGRVEKVDPLPITPRSWRSNQEIKNFLTKIKLNSIPRGLMPGMTATVEILTDRRSNALVVPTKALTVEGEDDICYVADGEDIQRRVVKVSPGNREVVEITEGIEEGEEVILEPEQLDLGGHRVAQPIGKTDPNWWISKADTAATN